MNARALNELYFVYLGHYIGNIDKSNLFRTVKCSKQVTFTRYNNPKCNVKRTAALLKKRNTKNKMLPIYLFGHCVGAPNDEEIASLTGSHKS